jgi:hypothetical protein
MKIISPKWTNFSIASPLTLRLPFAHDRAAGSAFFNYITFSAFCQDFFQQKFFKLFSQN